MDNRKSPSVIKLFFEVDDSKGNRKSATSPSLIDQVLNENEKLSKQLSAQNLELRRSRIKTEQLSKENKEQQRYKKETEKALAKAETELKNLELDLKTETELRRSYE